MRKIPWRVLWQRIAGIPVFAAEHAFLLTLLLIVIAALFALLLFYVYEFSSQTKRVGQEASLHDVKEELFLDTMGELEKRKANLEDVGTEPSRDIFNPH